MDKLSFTETWIYFECAAQLWR